MERAEYDKLDRSEDRMWWFAALHANLLAVYRRALRPERAGAILDAGCGTGGLLRRLAAQFAESPVSGLDADPLACARAREKSWLPICAGSVNALPFADAAFAAIFSADVLCHRRVDDERALAQFHRCLAPEGVVVLNLPAYRWMLSRHDEAVHNARRYTRSSAIALLCAAGFRPVFVGYWNMLLFPLMVMTRKLLPAGGGDDVKIYPRPVETLCRAATGLERLLLRRGIALPFGGSVLAVAVKEAGRHG
jgi:SAM-dependent methyltransferase